MRYPIPLRRYILALSCMSLMLLVGIVSAQARPIAEDKACRIYICVCFK